MDREEIIRTINSFPTWVYEFNLKGNLTPVADKDSPQRTMERKNYFFDPLVELMGGSLKGKRVLDIACNSGFYSLQAIEKGCDYVLGIDGRQMHIDQANFVFEASEVDRARYQFVAGNVFDVDFSKFGTFDIVICLGFFHHLSKHIQLLEKISEVNRDILLLESRVSRIPGAYMVVKHESIDHHMNSLDYPLTMLPTREALISMVQQFGYEVAILRPQVKGKAAWKNYRLGRRRAFLCSKKTDLSKLNAETEPWGGARDFMGFATLGAHWLFRRFRKLHML